MSLRDRINVAAKAALRTEIITLPIIGERVMVRGLMTGDAKRLNAMEGGKATSFQIALCTLDPESAEHEPLWNANDQKDHAEIDALPIPDATAITETINRLSGIGAAGEKEVKKGSAGSESLNSSSAPVSEELPQS